MENKIVLKRPQRKVGIKLTGVVRISPEAEEIVNALVDETELSAREVVSQMIIQGSKFTCLSDN